ncbi:MAG: hypothetical protein FJ404_19650 [Verrucomicrobia bacterium]|nr:hypothetical protein [Verrucomicrobiota bacterium]
MMSWLDKALSNAVVLAGGYQALVGSGLTPALLHRAIMQPDLFYSQSSGIEYYDAVWMIGMLNAAGPLKRWIYKWFRGLQALGVAVLAAWMANLERGLLLGVSDSAILGVYAAGAKVASLVLLPIGAFQAAWGPLSLAVSQSPEAGHTYSRTLMGLSAGFGVLTVGTHCFAPGLLRLLATDVYIAGAAAVGPLMLGHAVRAMGWVGGIGIDLSKRTIWVVPAQILGLLATVAGFLYLPIREDLLRVAWASALGQGVSACLVTWFGQRCQKQSIQFLAPILLIALSIAALALIPPFGAP